jgi:hypothetical protein
VETAFVMAEQNPTRNLLPTLGRLLRGLSLLFWLLPLAVISYVQTARTNWLFFAGPLASLPSVIASALLIYALYLLGGFQRQERIWIQAVERTKILALISLGFSPFLYWWQKVPDVTFFQAGVLILTFSGLGFLFHFNNLLQRLSAMLPDETLRVETRLFTSFNKGIIGLLPFFIVAYLVLIRMKNLPYQMQVVMQLSYLYGLWFCLALLLIPLSMTMALVWKVKEAVYTSIFEN